MVKQIVRVKKNHSVQNVLRAKTSLKQVVRVKTWVKQVVRVKASIKQTISLQIRPLIEIVYTYLIRYIIINSNSEEKKPRRTYILNTIYFFSLSSPNLKSNLFSFWVKISYLKSLFQMNSLIYLKNKPFTYFFLMGKYYYNRSSVTCNGWFFIFTSEFYFHFE